VYCNEGDPLKAGFLVCKVVYLYVLQCVYICCSVFIYVAVCFVTVRCGVVQCDAV